VSDHRVILFMTMCTAFQQSIIHGFPTGIGIGCNHRFYFVCQNVKLIFGSLIRLTSHIFRQAGKICLSLQFLTSHIFRQAGKICLSLQFVNLETNNVVKMHVIK